MKKLIINLHSWTGRKSALKAQEAVDGPAFAFRKNMEAWGGNYPDTKPQAIKANRTRKGCFLHSCRFTKKRPKGGATSHGLF